MSSILGPNTGASSDLLSRRVILCGGEDPGELVSCFDDVWPGILPTRSFEYRCYRFWQWPGRTIVWTGIGTGCMEPLLWEMFGPEVVKDIVLIGTAGRLPASKQKTGTACCVTAAYSGGTSIDEVAGVKPLVPRYRLGPGRRTASTVSTDYYYGFSDHLKAGAYPDLASLRVAFDRHFYIRDFVDMETAQFYYFCQALGGKELQYLAIRAAANDMSLQADQLAHSRGALLECLKLAVAVQDAACATETPAAADRLRCP